MRGWLQFCEANHGAQCMGSVELTTEKIAPSQSSQSSLNIQQQVLQPAISKESIPPDFRLIDTHAFCITKPDTPVPFVAFSYMWSSGPGGADSSDIKLEKANISLLESPGSLTARRPGSIYSSASFTIIAALDSRATDMGLPGHPDQARQRWSSAFRPPLGFDITYSDGFFCSVTPNGLRAIVDASMWNQRGWTFQERLLSKRRLFITEYEVIFQCASDTVEEGFTWDWNYPRLCATANTSARWIDESAYPLSPSELALFLMPGFVDDEEGMFADRGNKFLPDQPTLQDYRVITEDYSTRQLSFRSDKLNAFNGVANAMAAGFDTRMLFGVLERLFPRFLIWSWVSCAKPIQYHWTFHSGWNENDYSRHEDDECRVVQYYYQDPASGLRKLAIEQPPFSKLADYIIYYPSCTDLPRLPSARVRPPSARLSSPKDSSWRNCVHNPEQAASHSGFDSDAMRLAAAKFPGSLVFNTTVASLRIGGDDDTTFPTSVFRHYICNAAGDEVGFIGEAGFNWMRAQESSDGNKKMFDFIVLSGTWSGGEHIGGLNDDKKAMLAARPGSKATDYLWELTVMLVDRLPYEPFVVRRVDIGTIPVCLWNECNPKWESVILC
ncbi:hypothetical protein PG995_002696 [Apiospora arundinis]